MTILVSITTGSISPLAAQDTAAKVDPATIIAPDTRFTPTADDVGSYWKYFFFHKEGVSFDRALTDIAECDRYSNGPNGEGQDIFPLLPKFVALGEGKARVRDNSTAGWQYGLVGALIDSAISGPMLRKLRMASTRKCMEFKGYVRYGASKALWEELNGGDPGKSALVRAKIASGPAPTAERQLP